MATASASLDVDGLDTIDAALRDLPRAVQQEVLDDALHAGGAVIQQGIADRIHSRTGKTAADLRMDVEVRDDDVGGAVRIGAGPSTRTNKTGRTYVLRYLEYGTKAHDIPKKRGRIRRWEQRVGKTLKSINTAKRVAFGGHVYSRVHQLGITAQAPMRIALAEDADKAIKAFGKRAWDGIVTAVERLGKR